MAKLESISIKNVKGIQDVELEIEGGKSPGRFITLVGLNESGKTSILEGIFLSVLQDPSTADMLKNTNSALDISDVIPKHKSAAFTDKSEVVVTIDFSEDEEIIKDVKKIIIDNEFSLVADFSTSIEITKTYKFEDSDSKGNSVSWSFNPKVSKHDGNEEPLYKASEKTWSKCLEEFKKRLPQVIYFPTFSVDFPKRVYLEGDHGKLDAYYRGLLSDAWKGLENPLSISKHIVERINKHRKPGTPFSSALRASKEGKQIDATVQDLATQLNYVVFGAWSEIFDKPVRNRKIIVEWHIDEEQNNHVYVELYIIAGDNRFYISERSLGFRWFFSFLLFTQFQSSRAKDRKIVFLFDEPASHLHPKAQERLLKSFTKIAEPNHIVIYSTHSHYLINPLWLEQAYIIENAAIDSENDYTQMDKIEANVEISAKKYKTFVSENPSNTTYYQPILDVLDYSSGNLNLDDPVIILEGKFDYYPFKYFLEAAGRSTDFRIIPSVGSGGMSALIGILRGWRVRFIILLDDDDAGRKEKGKYKNDLLLSDHQVVTLDELDPLLKGKEFEGMFMDDVVKSCRENNFCKKDRPKKSEFYSFFQAINSNIIKADDLSETLKFFEKIIVPIAEHLDAQK